MGKTFVILIAVATFAACDHSERDAGKCAGYGFQPGTNEYASCLMQEDHTRRKVGAEILWQ